jgi:hypothetical protein
MSGCRCNIGLANTGRPNCIPIQSVASRLIITELGNNLDLTPAVNIPENIDDLFLAEDTHSRWFPLPRFENVEIPKADSKYEEAPSGRKVFLRQGKRSFMGELWEGDSHPHYLKQLQDMRCTKFGAYIIDVNNNLIGLRVGDSSSLQPIPLDNASWDPQMVFPTDSSTQKIKLSFDFDLNVDEGDLYMLSFEETNYDFGTQNGLIDVTITNTGNLDGDQTAILNISSAFITTVTPTPIEGLVNSILCTVNGSLVSPDTATETEPGKYVLTFEAGTFNDGDSVKFSLDLSSGYEGTLLFAEL